jgi:hypothetical protein
MATYQAEFTKDGQAVRSTVQARDMAAALRKLRRENPTATGLQVWLATKP